MAFFNGIKEKISGAAQSVSNKTRDGIEITRISGEIHSLREKENSLFVELGRAYYTSAGKDACDALCAQITELRDRVSAMEQRRMQLRNQNRCPSCGAVMNEGARFCSACGCRMPEAEPVRPAQEAENTQFCPECGAMRRDGTAFCDICGSAFGGASKPVKKQKVKPAPTEEAEEPTAEDTDEV